MGGVAADLDIVLDQSGFRVRMVSLSRIQHSADPAVVGLGQRGQLHAVVHAFDGERIRARRTRRPCQRLAGFQRVGQIDSPCALFDFQSGDCLGKHGKPQNAELRCSLPARRVRCDWRPSARRCSTFLRDRG